MDEFREKANDSEKEGEIKTYSVTSKIEQTKENIYSQEQIINQAINIHLQGNIPEAIKYYQYCIDKNFKDHKVFSNYGAILIDINKLKEAEMFIRKAIEIKPDFAEAHLNLGNILKENYKFEDAQKSYCKAIKLKPNLIEAHYNLGRILITLGDRNNAEISLRKAIKLKPDHADAILYLGYLSRANGNFKDAQNCSDKLMKIRPWSISGSYSVNYKIKSN